MTQPNIIFKVKWLNAKIINDWHKDIYTRKKKCCKDRGKKYFQGADNLIF